MPDRIGVSLEFTGDRLRANVDYVQASAQDDVAEFELPTGELRSDCLWIQAGSIIVILNSLYMLVESWPRG